MKIKNKIRFFIFFLFIIIILSVTSFKIYAETDDNDSDYENQNEPDYGQEKIIEALPENVKNELNVNEITPDNGGALSISISDIFGYLWNEFVGQTAKPLKMLASITGVVLLSAVVDTLRDGTSNSQTVKIFGIVAVLSGAGMMCVYVSDCIAGAGETLKAGGAFLTTFVPIFAGIMAVSGQLTTAPVFNSIILVAAQLFSHLMVLFLIPLTSSILGISVAGAVNPDWKIERIAETVKKVIIWALGLLITVFVGLLSVQSFITGSVDTVAMKAAKFAVSNSVPIVGGAVSDALATVKGSMGLLRGSTGTFGIIAGICVVLPSLLSLICYKFALSIAAAVSDLFGISQLSSLLKSGENVISIMTAMLFCFLLLTIISISLMLFMGAGNTA